MSVIGEIRASLDVIGFEQQLCVFAFLASYPLSLGGLVQGRGRRAAAIAAAVSAALFVLLTDPWMHGVLLVVAMMGGVGLFIVVVYGLEQLQRLAWREAPSAAPGEPETAAAAAGAEPERRRKLALRRRAGTT